MWQIPLNILLCLLSLNIAFAENKDKSCINLDMYTSQTTDFNSLVDKISCTPLDGHYFDHCLNLICFKEYLYVMGETISGRNVTIYNKKGEIIKNITLPDALIVNSMCIIPAIEELWVISQFKIISRFKLDGTLIKKFSLPFNCANIYAVNGQNCLIYSGGGNTNIENHYLALTDFKTIHKLYMPMRNKKAFNHWSLYAPDISQENLFILFQNIDTIYSYNIDNKELKPRYKLNFHGDFLSESQVPSGPNEDYEMDKIITQRKYIYAHYSFYQTSNKLFIKWVGKRNDFCMINLKDNHLYSFDRLFDNFKSNEVSPFVGSDKDHLYMLVQEKDLADHYLNIKCTYPAIRAILPNLSINGNNWILLTIKIKNEI